MMFNDEIYNNGGRPYFDFDEMAGFKIVPFIATHVKMKKFSSNQNSPICMKTTDIKFFRHDHCPYYYKFWYN